MLRACEIHIRSASQRSPAKKQKSPPDTKKLLTSRINSAISASVERELEFGRGTFFDMIYRQWHFINCIDDVLQQYEF